MKKRILIYAHYYAPDVASTGQILQDQAEGMRDDFDVTVICTVPSYSGVIDDNYQTKTFYKEKINGVNVIRIRVPEFTKASKLSRVRNLLVYYINAQKATKHVGHQDYVFTISQPPIMGGMLGIFGKRNLRTAEGKHPKLIYCIQDFNPEQIEATGYIKSRFILGLARLLDKRNCSKSDLVITVGRDLVETLKKRFNGINVPKHTMINNWINEDEIYPLEPNHPEVVAFKKKYELEDKFIIMYSGNIGLYYDLEGLIKVFEKFKNAKAADGREVTFVFVGAGSVLKNLIVYKEMHQMKNVYFIPYQDKDKLIYSLNAADVHLCVNAKGIKGVSCPSKFYGIAAVAKPVLGVLEKGAEVEMLINEIGCGKVSEPGDYKAFEENIRWFIDNGGDDKLASMGRFGRDYLETHLTKSISVKKYIDSIKEL